MNKIKALLKKVPGAYGTYHSLKRGYNAIISLRSPYLRNFPAGHFYSPLPEMRQILLDRETHFEQRVTTFPGIELRDERQLELLNAMSQYYDDLPFPELSSTGLRYYFQNDFFRYADAVVAYGMLRYLAPRRVIEVGSGFSSAAMLDTNDHFLHGTTHFTFIEPYPERLLNLLTEADKQRSILIRKPVQKVSLDIFEELDAGDILFIDSSHVVKLGSDVRHILSHVLPCLRPGVVIHFHDVFWPFEYPEAWVVRGTAWNEAYFIHSFLQFNTAFKIEYFNSYMAVIHKDAIREKMPLCLRDSGASLWIIRT